MVINFRTRRISRGACKLTQIPTFNNIKNVASYGHFNACIMILITLTKRLMKLSLYQLQLPPTLKVYGLGVIIFSSVFIKKSNQTEILFFFKPKLGQMTDFGSVRFFRTKTSSNRFGSVGSVCSVLA